MKIKIKEGQNHTRVFSFDSLEKVNNFIGDMEIKAWLEMIKVNTNVVINEIKESNKIIYTVTICFYGGKDLDLDIDLEEY
jgi:hypothetical protein